MLLSVRYESRYLSVLALRRKSKDTTLKYSPRLEKRTRIQAKKKQDGRESEVEFILLLCQKHTW